jgi:Response regulator with putative antiterminator output domain
MKKAVATMNSALLLSGSDKGRDLLCELLHQNSFKDIVTTDNANEAKRMLIDRDFSLCIINTPLRDEFGISFATDVADREISQVMVVVKSDLYDDVCSKVEKHGVFVLSKPISRQLFWSALKVLSASYRKLATLVNKNMELERKIEDIRLIDRAKCVLIEYLNMTEQQAHKYVEKQAMDMRLTKRDVAATILKTYES